MVQGDDPNQWHFAQKWQLKMIWDATKPNAVQPTHSGMNHFPCCVAKYGSYTYGVSREGGRTVERPPGCLYILNFDTLKKRYLMPSKGLRTIDNATEFDLMHEHTGAPVLYGVGVDTASEMRNTMGRIPGVETLPSGPP